MRAAGGGVVVSEGHHGACWRMHPRATTMLRMRRLNTRSQARGLLSRLSAAQPALGTLKGEGLGMKMGRIDAARYQMLVSR